MPRRCLFSLSRASFTDWIIIGLAFWASNWVNRELVWSAMLIGRLMGVSMLVFLGYTADNCFIPIWDDATIKLISTARFTRSGDLKKIMDDGMEVKSKLTEDVYCFPLAYLMWYDINNLCSSARCEHSAFLLWVELLLLRVVEFLKCILG